MASLIPSGSASGTGSMTLAAPVTNSNQTVTLPDATGTVALTSGLPASSQLAKAWVNYNGVTQTISGSYNVSSVTYVGTGIYTVNFTTAMPNANYSALVCGQASVGAIFRIPAGGTYTASALQVDATDATQVARINVPIYNVAVFSS